jgi:plastocyanin
MELLESLLNSPEPHARIAAATVKQFWDNNKSTPTEMEAPHVKQVTAPPGVTVISTIVEEMAYDITELHFAPGEEVELWLFNNDYMPHNLIIGMPGSTAELGKAAAAMGAKGFAKGFIPDNDKVIAATPLVNTGETFKLKFTMPDEPGEYIFVCTFPGHWMRMQGKIICQ